MDFDKINKWLSLFANLGVLLGIIFLSLEINQSNQIAIRDARIDVLDAGIGLEQAVLENPDLATLRTKLRSRSPELSETEEEQSKSIAGFYMTQWATINATSQTGFLPAANEQAYLSGASGTIQMYPGLAPYIEEQLIRFNIQPGAFSTIFDVVWEEIRKLKASSN